MVDKALHKWKQQIHFYYWKSIGKLSPKDPPHHFEIKRTHNVRKLNLKSFHLFSEVQSIREKK